jgi:hypothetical protein
MSEVSEVSVFPSLPSPSKRYSVPRIQKRIPLQERFEARISKNGSEHPYNPSLGKCWVWQGGLSSTGYGVFRVGHGSDRKMEGAHRISYQLFVGEIPEGNHVCHSCDNRLCVNPKHLFAATNLENRLDMVLKGRGNSQSRRLSFEDRVCLVKKVLSTPPTAKSYRELSREFGIHKDSVYRIYNGELFSLLKNYLSEPKLRLAA